MKINRTKIAIQKSGNLTQESLNLIKSKNCILKDENSLIKECVNKSMDVLCVRDDDIPWYVSTGIAKYGIIGLDVLKEKGFKNIQVYKELGFAKCSLVLASPINGRIKSVEDLNGTRIATSFPNILKAFLKERGLRANIITIQGSVEIAPALDISDTICDIVQTGNTLKENGLKQFETVLESQAVLITQKNSSDNSTIACL